MHPVILILFAILISGTAIKFDEVKLKAALDKGAKDPEQVPCWNGSRWGGQNYGIIQLMETPGLSECTDCPCLLAKSEEIRWGNNYEGDSQSCEKCDVEKTRELAKNHSESKFTSKEVEECGTKSNCGATHFLSGKCANCPKMIHDSALKKFEALLNWLLGLQA